MKTLGKFLKTTLVGGMLVLFPVFGSAYLMYRLATVLINFIKPLLSFVPGSRHFSLAVKDGAAFVILLLCCFLIGLLVKMSVGRAVGRWTEANLLSKLPGYNFFKHLSHLFFGQEETGRVPVMVDRLTFKQLGFLIEEDDSDELTVFIPAAPGLLSGSVITVKQTAVERLKAAPSDAARVVMSYGLGTSALLRGAQPFLPPQDSARDARPPKTMLKEKAISVQLPPN